MHHVYLNLEILGYLLNRSFEYARYNVSILPKVGYNLRTSPVLSVESRVISILHCGLDTLLNRFIANTWEHDFSKY